MKKLAIVFGGDSLEHDVSIVTALLVIEQCKKHNIPYLPIYIDRQGCFFSGATLENKENYKKLKGFKKLSFKFKNGFYQAKVGFKYHIIEAALICVHGKNVEDGTVGALFDIMKIPCTYSGVFNSALLQDKEWSKVLFKRFKIPCVSYQVIHNIEESKDLVYRFPCIVKPAHLGSSIGVNKAKSMNELAKCIKEVFSYDDKIIIEDVVKNLHEFNIAAIGDKDHITLSSIEEVNSSDKVLDFSDKYEQFKGKINDRIIPAKINSELEEKIKSITRDAFKKLECFGVMRFDYLYDDKKDKLYLNEINAIPGSLAFYLFEPIGISFKELINSLKKLALKRYQTRRKLMSSYVMSDLLKIARKK